jgi:hypothetical protein
MLRIVMDACHPNYMGGVNRRIVVQPRLCTITQDPTWSKLKQKRMVVWLKWESICLANRRL